MSAATGGSQIVPAMWTTSSLIVHGGQFVGDEKADSFRSRAASAIARHSFANWIGSLGSSVRLLCCSALLMCDARR